MVEQFLKAKHWQLFILIFGIPVLFQFMLMGELFANIHSETAPDRSEFFNWMTYFPIIMIFTVGMLFGWFWSIAIGLQGKVPEHIQMKTKKFKILFFIPLIYIICVSLFIGGVFKGFMNRGNGSSIVSDVGIVGIILPMHLLSMFGIFYAMYFVAKTIKTVELQKEVKFEEFAGEFFMLWFYFIGIWILQPKINKIAGHENTVSNSLSN